MSVLPHEFSSGFGRGDLPCTEPSAAALEAGLFGIDEHGAFVPNADDVRAITAEHARELWCLLVELDYMQHCSQYEIDPLSWQAPRSGARRVELRGRLAREAEKLQQQYQGALAAYVEGSGEEGAAALDRFIRENLPAGPRPSLQQEMF